MNSSLHNNNFFTGIFYSSPYGILVVNTESNFIEIANPRILNILEIELDDLIGKHISYLFGEHSLASANISLNECLKAGNNVQIKVYKKNGTPIWVQLNTTQLSDGNNNYIICNINDISERVELNTTIKFNQVQYKRLFEFSINGIAIFDMDNRKYVDCNETFSQMYGYTKEELRNISALDLTWEEGLKDLSFYEKRYQENYESLKNDEILKFESVHKTKSNTKLYVNITLVPLQENGKLYVKQITEDITMRYLSSLKVNEVVKELNKVNIKLNESNQLLESYAFIISHDLREPVRTIVGLSQLFRKNIASKNEKSQEEFTQLIEKAGRHLNSMITDILSFSRVKNDKLSFESFDIEITIEKVLLHLRELTTKLDVQFTLLSQLPDRIIAHPTYIYQVFQNLIKNALKFRKKNIKCEIKIAYKELETHHQFSIADNGIGIEEKNFNKIFQLFSKLHHRKKYEGTGIGLSVCKKIIELHEGKIWLESTFGEGTTFYFTINKNLEITEVE